METSRQHDAPATRRLERVARLLAERGHDVTVFCGQWWDSYDEEMVVDGVRYRAVTLGTATASFFARLPVLLARYRPDVIHTRPTPSNQVIATVIGSTAARAPLVIEWYGTEEVDPDERATRWAATKPRRVVTPSEFVRTAVREMGGTDDRTCVIPESIDFSAIGAVDPAEEVDVAYAHPLDGNANVDDLLLGLAELRERDWSAMVVGDGPRREEYESEVAKLRIDDRVQFAGACDRTERLSIYRGAHAFVQTAYREVFATELLWALACGCIGIVEYQAESSAHELIENYERSYRVTDPKELANAIVDAAEFEQLTADDHWKRYDHGAVAQQYIDAYERIQGQRHLLSR